MNSYFNNYQRIRDLWKATEAWRATPFAINQCVRGAGVDCVRFVAEVLVECGHLKGYEFPVYTLDGGSHKPSSTVVEWLSHQRFCLTVSEISSGDVLVFTVGRGVSHHVGIETDVSRERFYSALGEDGVRERRLSDPTWKRRIASVWRPIE